MPELNSSQAFASVFFSKFESDDFYSELLLSFRQDYPLFAQQLGSSLLQNNYSELASHAHRLKGSALVLGIDGLAALFHDLELVCNSPETNGSQKLAQVHLSVAYLVKLMSSTSGQPDISRQLDPVNNDVGDEKYGRSD